MTNEDSRGEGADDGAEGQSDEVTPRPSSDDTLDDRTRRPLLAGLLGLFAGIAGGIAGTTIAPNSLLLTIVLVVGVAGVVTLGALRLLARRD